MNKYLVTMALLLVFGTSAYMSIYGLTAVFMGMTAVVVCMGLGMELGKILAVVHLHRNWKGIGWIPRGFYIAVISALTLITSCEVLGFLTQRHASSAKELKTIEMQANFLKTQEAVLRNNIAAIDSSLAALPAGYVTKRFRERENAGYWQINDHLLDIIKAQGNLKSRYISDTAYLNPIATVSRIFALDAAKTVSVFILLLVAVLEPLSIGLAVAASSAWGKDSRSAKTAEAPAENTHPYTVEFKQIIDRHNLTAEAVGRITGRTKTATIGGWLIEEPVIPIKSLRLLRQWAARRPQERPVKI